MPVFDRFEEVVEFDRYQSIPEDWLVIAADIVNSREAIKKGKYKQVNVLSAAIITAVSKLFYPRKVPYIFGGDGVFICIPPKKINKTREILAHVRLMAERQFGLQQKSGMVPVKDIRDEGYEVRVARYYISDNYKQAVFQGEGLSKAEQMVRDSKTAHRYQVPPQLYANTDLSNLECRWNHMNSVHDEIVCLLVKVTDQEQREQIYRRVVHAINRIYCKDFICKPVREQEVDLTFKWDRLSVEYKVRTFGKNWMGKALYFLKLYAMQIAGKFVIYFGLNADGADWSRYKTDLEENTDYRKFDDMVREVLSGSKENREKLIEYLEDLYQEGEIAYGLHVTPTVMLTCMVMNYDQEHFHFVDGSAGGYAAAAEDLKSRMLG